MNFRFFQYFPILIFIFSINISFGQTGNKDTISDISTDLKDQLPPVDNLVQIAIKNSPFLKLNDALVEKSEHQTTMARREWHNNIALGGNYTKGNQRFLIATTAGEMQNNFLDGYRVGLNVTLPLSLITARGAKIKAANAETKATEFQREQAELELKGKVVQDYYELIAANNVLQIKSLAKENADLQNELAEKKFAEGSMSLEEYTMVGRSVTTALVDYEVAKASFFTRYKQFEQLLGVSLENLRKRK